MLCRFLKRLGLIIGCQVVNDFPKVALQNIFQFVKRQADSMIGYPALGKIVGSDATASVTRADLTFTFLGSFFVLFHNQLIQQTGSQDFHGFHLVFELGFLVLASYHEAGRKMGDAHCLLPREGGGTVARVGLPIAKRL